MFDPGLPNSFLLRPAQRPADTIDAAASAFMHRPFAILLDTPAGARRLAAYAFLAVLVGGLGWWQTAQYRTPVFPVDDAYISLHSAEVLYHGVDERYPGTPALAGATSPIHVTITAALLPFLQPVWAHWLTSWLGILAYVLALARLAFTLGAGPIEALLVVLAGVLIGETPHQLLNGLETGWAMAGMTWAFAAACDSRPRRTWELPLACGVLPFLRPELAALSGLLLLLRAWEDWQKADGWPDFSHRFARSLAWTTAGALPWLLLTLMSTGSPIPATALAKRNYFAQTCMPAAARRFIVGLSLERFQKMVGWFALLAILLPLHRVGRIALAFAAVLVFSYYVNFPSALGQDEQRYLYVLVPLLLLAPLVATATRRPPLRVAAALLLMLGIAQASVQMTSRWQQHLHAVEYNRTELAALTEWVNTHIPTDATVLIHDAGYISYATRLRLVDLVGLKSPANLRPHADLTYPSCGARRGDALAAIALRERARYLVALEDWDAIHKLTPALIAHGWTATERWRSPYADRWRTTYTVYELGQPAAATLR